MRELIQQIKINLEHNRYPNETAVSMGIVIRVLQSLDWPTGNMKIVYPEFPLESRKVDFGLCPKGDDIPKIIIEVKRVGNLEAADQQLFEYAFLAGAGVAVLTDGKEWHFYFPVTTGSFNDKRFYKLDLMEQELEEIVKKFERYLSYDNVHSDRFLEFAQQDLKKAKQAIEAKETIPEAFKKLIESDDEQLIQIIAEKVADQCGFSPDNKLITDFLNTLINKDLNPPPAIPKKIKRTNSNTNEKTQGLFYFRLGNHETNGKNATDLFLNAMTIISQHFESAISKYHSELQPYNRKVISRQKDELFPNRPDMIAQYSKKLETGYWVDKNNSTKTKRNILNSFIKIIGNRDSELKL
jgi:predicted type IV restriction endonuclease